MVWLRRLLTPSAAKRAIRSLAPPGPKPTTQRMGRSGHSARAGSTAATHARNQTAKPRTRTIAPSRPLQALPEAYIGWPGRREKNSQPLGTDFGSSLALDHVLERLE